MESLLHHKQAELYNTSSGRIVSNLMVGREVEFNQLDEVYKTSDTNERLAKSDKLSCSIFSIDRTPHIQPIFYSI
ncbi:MAG: hypothetical protein QJT81_03730 [Candidatus Thiothrix putei]|uniref:Uncharacterized protein n=1 Tax=Candidatus Thiothrix putei TaxID=3080811 RepID=A0AA95HIK8_9GAMM|nr:MAG: hypothetical protein QJT81_03730 [Candidatus Thiothrix putei]